MEPLTVSAKNLLLAPPLKTRDFSPSAAAQTRFSTPIHHNVDRLSRSISLKPLRSISELKSSSSSFSRTAKAMTDALNEAMYEQKTVHVKFQLQKKCMFGERFLLVGNDPILGLWDPASAIPMEWSDDHIWTAELDLPVGKSFQFKFILRGEVGNVFWQPDRDRILETWETRNTIVVSEDWENAEVQKISEEPSILDQHLNASDWDITEIRKVSKEPSKDLKEVPDKHLDAAENIPYMGTTMVSDNQVVAVADNITFPRAEDKTAYLKEKASASTNKGIATKNKTNKIKKPSVKPKEGSLVAEDIFGSAGIVATDKKLGGTQDGDLVDYAGETVLVPGLTHMTEEVFSAKPESKKVFEASFGNDEAEDPDMPEEHEKQEETTLKAEECANEAGKENLPNVGRDRSDSPPGLHKFMKRDIQAMKKVLTILGFNVEDPLKE